MDCLILPFGVLIALLLWKCFRWIHSYLILIDLNLLDHPTMKWKNFLNLKFMLNNFGLKGRLKWKLINRFSRWDFTLISFLYFPSLIEDFSLWRFWILSHRYAKFIILIIWSIGELNVNSRWRVYADFMIISSTRHCVSDSHRVISQSTYWVVQEMWPVSKCLFIQ